MKNPVLERDLRDGKLTVQAAERWVQLLVEQDEVRIEILLSVRDAAALERRLVEAIHAAHAIECNPSGEV